MTEVNTQVENTVEVEATEIQKSIAEVKGFVVYKFPNKEQTEQVLSTLTEEVLLDSVFKPCGKYDAMKSGFTPFKSEDTNFLLKVKGSVMFQVSTQEKKPHTPTVKKLCKIEEAKYKLENDIEKLDKDAKAIIKMSVIEGLLPTTTPEDPKTTLLWVTGEYLIVGNPTYKKSEEFVATLRQAVGSCPVEPIEVVEDVSEQLTFMLETRLNDTIALLNLVHLGKEGSKAVIKFEKEDLLGGELGSNGKKVYDVEVKPHLKEDFKVSKMQLTKDFEIDFTLNDEFEFSGIKVDKEVLSGSKDLGALIITVDEVNKAVDSVVKVFGGLKEDA